MKIHHALKHTKTLGKTVRSLFWFSIGVVLGLFFLCSFAFIYFKRTHTDVIYPGIVIGSVQFGGKTQQEVKDYFDNKNKEIGKTQFILTGENHIATISAFELTMGYDSNLLSEQAFSIGRATNLFSNINLIFQAYLNGLYLPPAYYYSEAKLETFLMPIATELKIEPVDALFSFTDGKVTAFRPSSDGQELDTAKIKKAISSKALTIVTAEKPLTVIIPISIKTLNPAVTTDRVNNLGIKEELESGTSYFRGSIQNRIFNITLAAARLNGHLVAPGEIFSFNKALGDVSAFTGYKQAYVIQNGRTVLGDGGGVCQVSTTLFRAILNAGLPIVERHAHAYRVQYYEQDSSPGIDATVFVPSVDLRFKNDTNHHILIQNSVDPVLSQLTFTLYGAKDGREVTMTQPVITSQTPPPEPLYQDDPTLPKGTTKQVDFAASGAKVSFTRTVSRNGEILISEKFASNYRPWQAVYLRGTKE